MILQERGIGRATAGTTRNEYTSPRPGHQPVSDVSAGHRATRRRRKQSLREPDIIVIGGGSAGAAMTGRLAQAGVNVTLLEAGVSDRHLKSRVPALTSSIVQNPDFDWFYKT